MPIPPIIMKFGGTSMRDAATIQRSAGIARTAGGDSTPVVAVVSAMDQVTELLLDAAATAARPDDDASLADLLAQIRARHESAARDIGASAPARVGALLDDLDRLLRGIQSTGELTPRSRDAVVAFGEMLSTRLMGAALGCPDFTGKEVGLITDDRFGQAAPLMDLSFFQIRHTLDPVLSTPSTSATGRAVVSGFIAATQHGLTTTLGRGGSDYTACILGAALNAREIWIWSDVDGLLSADPRIVPSARLLDTVSFAEAIEMGQFGAKSMHPLALEPAAERGISVRFRNTFNLTSPGTLIVPPSPIPHPTSPSLRHSVTPPLLHHPVKCCLLYKNAALLTISGAAMIGRPGTAARAFAALADASINIMMISQSVSEAGISVVVNKDRADDAKAALEHALMRPGHARAIAAQVDVAVVAAVGEGMHGAPGIAAKIFSAVAAKGVNVIAIAQGSSELSISFVVEAEDGPEAVRALHEVFVG